MKEKNILLVFLALASFSAQADVVKASDCSLLAQLSPGQGVISPSIPTVPEFIGTPYQEINQLNNCLPSVINISAKGHQLTREEYYPALGRYVSFYKNPHNALDGGPTFFRNIAPSGTTQHIAFKLKTDNFFAATSGGGHIPVLGRSKVYPIDSSNQTPDDFKRYNARGAIFSNQNVTQLNPVMFERFYVTPEIADNDIDDPRQELVPNKKNKNYTLHGGMGESLKDGVEYMVLIDVTKDGARYRVEGSDGSFQTRMYHDDSATSSSAIPGYDELVNNLGIQGGVGFAVLCSKQVSTGSEQANNSSKQAVNVNCEDVADFTVTISDLSVSFDDQPLVNDTDGCAVLNRLAVALPGPTGWSNFIGTADQELNLGACLPSLIDISVKSGTIIREETYASLGRTIRFPKNPQNFADGGPAFFVNRLPDAGTIQEITFGLKTHNYFSRNGVGNNIGFIGRANILADNAANFSGRGLIISNPNTRNKLVNSVMFKRWLKTDNGTTLNDEDAATSMAPNSLGNYTASGSLLFSGEPRDDVQYQVTLRVRKDAAQYVISDPNGGQISNWYINTDTSADYDKFMKQLDLQGGFGLGVLCLAGGDNSRCEDAADFDVQITNLAIKFY